MGALNNFFFIALPYVALAVFLAGTIARYTTTKFQVSSLSSQFLEGKKLFWGSVPFHWGLMFLFFGHLIAFLVPRGILAWNSHPVRLLILEISSLIFGITVLVGLIQLYTRRVTNERVRSQTTRMDIFVELLLLLQFVTGIYSALTLRWGSAWFASVMSPYLKSIFVLNPDIAAVSAMPLMFKLHVIGAFVIVLIIPFSRLIHFLVVPLNYMWKPMQQVMWNWDRKKIRSASTPWAEKRPQNN